MRDERLPQIPGYELGKRLGERTFRATTRRFDRALVVKIHPLIEMRTTNVELLKDAERLTTYLHSLRRLSSLKPPEAHPRIAPILDFGAAPLIGEQGWQVGAYLTMPFYSQGHLGDVSLDDDRLADTVGYICDGLADLQRAGLAHGHLMPDTIFLDGDRRPLLAYPDLTTPVTMERQILHRSSRQMRLAAYLSPEYLRDGRASIGGDLYSVGCILYERLVGNPPFTDADPLRIARQHIDSTPPALPADRAQWQTLVSRCLAKSPQERYLTPFDLKQALWDLAGRGPLPSRDPTRDPEAATRRDPATSRTARGESNTLAGRIKGWLAHRGNRG